VGLPATVLCCVVVVGIGVAWFTPEIAYAPTMTCVEPDIVTTIFPIPLGFTRYQNSASLLTKDLTLAVKDTPPNVMEDISLLSALTPTTSSLLSPVPALKFASVIWCDDDTVPDVD
jgi:hypothetical protein